MKKTTAAGIIVLSVYCVSCGSVPAAVPGGGDFLYSVNQYGGITIIEYRGPGKNIIIPETINGLPVNVIGRGSFAGKGITEAELPETVFRIEDRAFLRDQLQTVKLPPGLRFIGDEAFKQNRLETVDLPEGITEIGARAFEKNRLVTVKLPESLKYTGDYCFADNRIKSVEFPETISVIPFGMFAVNKIVILRLPDTVKLIGLKAFTGNPMEALSFWGGKYVEKDAFENTKLKVVGIAENVHFDSPNEIGAGFQSAYKSMGGMKGVYYEQTDNFWWVKEE
jgi:hypothetical protein